MSQSKHLKATSCATMLITAAGCSTPTDNALDLGQLAQKQDFTWHTVTTQEQESLPLVHSVNADISVSNVIYFDYETVHIRNEFKDDLLNHAIYLSEHPSARLRIEGHADESSTKQSNFALGARRALTVSRYLVMHGAQHDAIEWVSYGDHFRQQYASSASTQANRRVNLRYLAY